MATSKIETARQIGETWKRGEYVTAAERKVAFAYLWASWLRTENVRDMVLANSLWPGP